MYVQRCLYNCLRKKERGIMTEVGIIGGGISGLTAGFFLQKAGIPFTLFEASNKVGGKIRSERNSGYLVEYGPNSLQTSTPLLNQLIEETGLSTHQIFAAERAKKRFVVQNGTPQPLPMSPPALLSSSFFPLRTKLRLMREPFIRAYSGDTEESVAGFIKRRLGQDILDYAVDPFVTGIFAGNPANLSLRHAFPLLYDLEREHGSLLKGLRAKRKAKKNTGKKPEPRRIFSFVDGVAMLPEALSAPFAKSIHCNSKVLDIRREKDKWMLTIEKDGQTSTTAFDMLLNTLPLPAFQHLDLSVKPDLSSLWNVEYPPVTVLALGFNRDDVDHPLDGFGMLVPGKENGIRILGSIFSSTVFPDRAPEGSVLLTTLVGGARKGDFCHLPDDLLMDFVLDDLHNLLGVHGNPTFVKKIEWPQAIPQYNVGYGAVKQTLRDLEEQHSGLFMAGNYRDGISVGEAVTSGHLAAERMLASMGKSIQV